MKIGTVVKEFIPQGDNGRNSEGAFLTLRDGRILFVYSRFHGGSEDFAGCDLARSYSADGGRSWSEPEIFLRAAQCGSANIMSVSLFRMQNDDAGLLFLQRGGDCQCDLRPRLCRSTDEGATWSRPRLCIRRPGYYVVNNDRVVRLSDGRLVFPCGQHENHINPDGTRFFGGGRTLYYASDDDGESFTRLCAPLPFDNPRCESGLQEPGLIELADGRLWGWARTDLGGQYEFFSDDGGRHWTPPRMSCFSSPCSPLSMKRAPDGRLLAVWNPIPAYSGRGCGSYGGRTPLALAFSADEGRSWTPPQVIEDDPAAGYCYIAVHFTDGALLLAYCAGGPSDSGCLNRLRLRRITWDELQEEAYIGQL